MDNSVFGIYDESQLDLDYFKTLIQQNENRTSYLEACDIKLKMEQEDFNPQGKCRTSDWPDADSEELKYALDEIKKNEKDLSMVVMIAQTLFEKTEDLQRRQTDLDEEREAIESREAQMQAYTEDGVSLSRNDAVPNDVSLK